MSWLLAVFSAALAFAGCGGATAPPPDIDYSLVDTGQVCLSATVEPGASGAGTFAADAPVYVSFDAIGVCLSSSCTRDPLATCEVTRVGGGIAVASLASWTDTSPSADACTADCGLLSATCQLDSLPAGTYTVRYGGQALTLTVPTQLAAAPCMTAGD